jgi:hypothetical protein
MPTLTVAALTPVTVSRRPVVARVVNDTVVPVPSLASVGTATVEPSEKVSVPPVIWSEPFGRSWRTTWSSVTADGHVSCNQLPVLPPEVAHSLV